MTRQAASVRESALTRWLVPDRPSRVRLVITAVLLALWIIVLLGLYWFTSAGKPPTTRVAPTAIS